MLSLIRQSTATKPRSDQITLFTDDVYIIRGARLMDRMRFIRYRCKHTDQPYFEINAYGEHRRLSSEFFNYRIRCGVCEAIRLKQKSIRCSKCGFIIQENEEVTLHSFSDMSEAPEYAYVVIDPRVKSPETPFSIACMRPACNIRRMISYGIFTPNRLFQPRNLARPPLHVSLWRYWQKHPIAFPVVSLNKKD